MNERDYLLMEGMIIAAGSFVLATIVSMYIIFQLPVGMDLVVVMCFIAFCTFFFGLYTHMKRRIFIMEMTALSKEAKDEMDRNTKP